MPRPRRRPHFTPPALVRAARVPLTSLLVSACQRLSLTSCACQCHPTGTRRAASQLALRLLLGALLLGLLAPLAVGQSGPASSVGYGTSAQPQPIDTHGGGELTDLPHANHDDHADHDPAVNAPAPRMSRAQHQAFAQQVNLRAIRELAVFDDGRVKTLETLAAEQINRIYGKRQWRDVESGFTYDPVFTYFDLLLNRDYYMDQPIVNVEVLAVRNQLLSHLPEDEQELWRRRGRITPRMYLSPPMQAVLTGQGTSADLQHFNGRQRVHQSWMQLNNLGHRLYMVSPPTGSDTWIHLAEIGDALPDAESARIAVANVDAARQVRDTVIQLASAWPSGDAAAVNPLLAQLAGQIPTVNAETYPPRWRLNLETLYNTTARFTVGYAPYLLGALALLLAFSVQRRWLIRTGVGLLLTGFAVHSAAMLARGILAGRWPIHNQFESFMAVTWFAVLIGIVLMFARRQWLFGAAAAALGACAMLLAHTVELPSSNVAQAMPILATSNILYIHVNMVLISYALIALAFFASAFYLFVYYFGDASNDNATASTARGGDAGMLQFAAAGLGRVDDASTAQALPSRQALLNDLDTVQLIVMQLAFWVLGTGVLLGAYWADHAWGRWWGWDPKETFALVTWIIYLIAIHVRLGVRRRGLVTAWLSVAGFVVMLWTWWGVNLLLPGLHSYA